MTSLPAADIVIKLWNFSVTMSETHSGENECPTPPFCRHRFSAFWLRLRSPPVGGTCVCLLWQLYIPLFRRIYKYIPCVKYCSLLVVVHLCKTGIQIVCCIVSCFLSSGNLVVGRFQFVLFSYVVSLFGLLFLWISFIG